MRTILRSERQRPMPMSATFHRAQIGEEEIAAVIKTLRSGYLTFGPKTHEFQQAFAETIGAAQAIAVNSCTAALHLALDALELPPGAEVITSTLTFTATAAAIVHAGAKPVLADVTPDTLNLDPHDVERKITPQTRAIVPVHFAGHPAPMEELLELARRHDLRMVEDAAHALPASHRGRRIGTIGDVTAFSFNATENLTTGDGGMVTTCDAELANRMWTRRYHGIYWAVTRDRRGPCGYDVSYPGFKYNMTDIAAAIGLVQLRRLPVFARRRAQIAALYRRLLSDVPQLELPTARPEVEHAWQLYIVRLRPERTHLTRDALIETLRERGVLNASSLTPLHHHSYYRAALGVANTDFPVASELAQRMLSLPLSLSMSDNDVTYVAQTLRDILSNGR